MIPKRFSVLLVTLPVAVLLFATVPTPAATVVTNAADWGFTNFLTAPNSTSRGWNFGNTAANAPTVTLNGVGVIGNLGVDDPATGLDFTTNPLTYAISGYDWQATTEQRDARNNLSKGGLHGGTGTFAMNLGGTPGNTYLVEIVSLQNSGTRSMDVSVDGTLVMDEWQVPGVTPHNRVLKIEAVCDADGVDLAFGRGSTGTDQNPAIVALAITQTSPQVALSILASPQGFTNFAGEFSVAGSLVVWAGGSGTLSYQWQKNGADISGATKRSLPFAHQLSTFDAGVYRAIVNSGSDSVTSLVATVAIVPVTSVTDALAGYWTFNETSGTNAADSSLAGNPGALINFPTDDSQWVAGQVGGALKFRGGAGLNDYVFVTNYPKPSVTLTISAWVWAEARQSFATIVKNWPGANGQFHLGQEGTAGDLSNYLRQQGGAQVGPVREGASLPLPLNSWQHVALVCDGRLMRLYRNGLQVGTPVAYNGTINTNPLNASLSIGAKWQATTPDSFWKGNIDDLGLWTRALGADEVFSIYKAGTNGQPLTTATVGNAPEVLVPPQNVTRYEGEFAPPLSVMAVGTAPLFYQWRRGDEDLAGQTNAALPLNQLSNSAVGTYVVVVSNSFGAVTSAPAVVVVQTATGITDALAGYWNFDEGTGTVLVDNSGNGNDGTLMNYPDPDTQWVPGQIGTALMFRGAASSNYVVVPNYPKPSAALTLAAWVWADARPTWASILKNWPGTSNQFHLGLESASGDLSHYLMQQGGTQVGPVREGSTNPFPLGAWQHVAVACDGAVMRLYRNSTLVGTLAYNGTIQTSPVNQGLGIGAKLAGTGLPTSDASYWQGKMDDIGLWTRSLSADEILAIYIAGVNGRPLSDAVVGAVGPTFAAAPQSQTVTEGEAATFIVQAAGTPPLSYQWLRNGAVIAGATNTSVTVGNLCQGDGATFAVVVCNVAGCVTSDPPATLTVAPLVPTVPITEGLVGHWKFDETAGATAADSTAYANHGGLTNFPADNSQWVRGQIGGALNFRGPASQDYVVVPDYPKPSSNLTIAAWIWAEARPTWASIVKNWPSEPGGEIHFGLNNVEGDLSNYLIQQGGTRVGPVREGADAPLPLGSWQHVALVCDGSTMHLYRNGLRVGAPLAYNGTINTNLANQTLAIGAKLLPTGVPPTTADAGYWQGKMDDLGLWHRGLSAAEIQAIYNAGLDGRDLTKATIKPGLHITRVGSDVLISWPAAPAGNCFVLEWTGTLPATSWTPVGVTPVLSNGRYWVTFQGPADTKFYRLMKQ
ncbi:MAG: hypothetical protein HZA90_11050 [Verrucomicrobia bacterium]|nr:hypothetical protein [Verrucomicrobiota bacterium]